MGIGVFEAGEPYVPAPEPGWELTEAGPDEQRHTSKTFSVDILLSLPSKGRLPDTVYGYFPSEGGKHDTQYQFKPKKQLGESLYCLEANIKAPPRRDGTSYGPRPNTLNSWRKAAIRVTSMFPTCTSRDTAHQPGSLRCENESRFASCALAMRLYPDRSTGSNLDHRHSGRGLDTRRAGGSRRCGRSQCSNHLKQLGLALHSYVSASSVLPINDDYYSFQSRLLPYLELVALYNSINYQPPDSGANKTVRTTTISLFLCPSDGMEPPWQGWNNYGGNVGTGRQYGGPDGLIGQPSILVPDGGSQTAAMAEGREGARP